MAGAGYKLFNTGDVLTAAQVNTYLMEQTVMVFANATARTSALSGVLAEGMVSYLQDTNALEVYNGSAWVGAGSSGDIEGVTAGVGISGGGTSGTVTITNSMATAIDAKGDLIVGTGADTFARLAVGGTNGHVLQVDSSTATGLKWAAAAGGGDGPAFFAKLSSSQTITSGSTDTVVTFNAEEYDTDSCFNTTNYRFTPNKEGYYLLTSTMYVNNYTGSAAQLGTIRILKNGTDQFGIWRGTGSYDNGAGFDNPGYSGSSVILYANGTTDYFQVEVNFEGANRTVVASGLTRFTGVYVRGA